MRSRRLIAGARDVERRPRDCCLQTPAARKQQTPELTHQLLELRFGPGNSDRTRRPRLVEFERQGFRGQWRHIDNGIEQPKLRRHSPLQPGLSGPTGLSSEPGKPQGMTRAWATANTLRTNTTHKVNGTRLFGEARNLWGECKKTPTAAHGPRPPNSREQRVVISWGPRVTAGAVQTPTTARDLRVHRAHLQQTVALFVGQAARGTRAIHASCRTWRP